MALSVGTDSYIDIADADTYFGNRLNTDLWTNADTETKEKALKQATRMLDDLFVWAGELADESQVLGWPRSGVYDCEGREIDSSEIPVQVEEATCEQALYLLGSIDPTQKPDLIKQGFKKAKLGPMEVETDSTMIADKIAPIISDIIGCLGSQKASATSRGVFQGQAIRN